MFFKLFLLFSLIPVLELYILIKVGGIIGALNTVLIILITATAGAVLTKQQGASTISRIKISLSEGRMPAKEMFDALFILLGGFTLLTPGFLTDIIGLTMLIPFTRNFYINLGKKIITEKIFKGIWKIKWF
jgi:UPF0716 protein FxsA